MYFYKTIQMDQEKNLKAMYYIWAWPRFFFPESLKLWNSKSCHVFIVVLRNSFSIYEHRNRKSVTSPNTEPLSKLRQEDTHK